MNDMLTDKQIANLRKIVRYRWIPWLMLLMGAFFLFAAVMKLLFVQKLCSLSGLTWNHVLALSFSRPEPAETYKGIEVLAAGGIESAILYFGSMAVFVVFHFTAKLQRRKDALLLELIDKHQRIQPEVGQKNMNQRIKYGHRHIGLSFKPILLVEPNGFEYKGKLYQWSDIRKIKRYDSAFWSLIFYQAGTPLAYLFLNDGSRIKIRGRVLEIEGENTKVDSVRGATDAYDQLMELITEKTEP